MTKQSGDLDIRDDFYENIMPYLKNAKTLMNLGCGERFNFERILKSRFSKINVTSADRLIKPNFEIPSDKYNTVDLEKIIKVGHYDVITFFEVIEHLDNTDSLMRTCYQNLLPGGLLIFSFPNLASIYGRIELLLGYQPHILEVSNEAGHFGTGIFGKLNGNLQNESIHHIRGITAKAMTELIKFHGFKLIKQMGASTNKIKIFNYFPSIAPVNIMICKKPI